MRFLVIGDSCTDRFVYGKCERICPEAPVPVFTPVKQKENGGMAKNVCANVRALGEDCDVITHSNEITKTRYVDIKTNQMLLRVDEDDKTDDRFHDRFMSGEIFWGKYDAVLISNYGKGFLTFNDIKTACLHHDYVFLDNNKIKIKQDLPVNLKFLKINQYELEINRHLKLKVDENHSSAYNRADQIIVTYGHKGCKYMGKMYPPTKRVITQDLSGAGDTFLAALAVSIMKGEDVETAIKFANDCALLVVSKRGVATV